MMSLHQIKVSLSVINLPECRSHLPYIAALLAAMAACFLYLSPFYELPQNDDWAYFQSLEYWINTGTLKHWGWNDPTLVFQLAWGKLFAYLFGLSYSTLRISTLTLFVCGVLAMYFLQIELAIKKPWALLGALLLFFNPFALTLAYSYNSDIPYLSLTLLGQFFFIRGSLRNSLVSIAIASLFWVAAFLVRQTTLAIIFISVPCLFFFSGVTRKKTAIAMIVLPCAIAFVLYLHWMAGQEYLGWPFKVNNPVILSSLKTQAEWVRFLVNVGKYSSAMFLHLGLFLSPLLASIALVEWRSMRASRKYFFYSLLILFVLVKFWLEGFGVGWPYIGNYLTGQGLFSGEYSTPVMSDDAFELTSLLSAFFAAVLCLPLLRLIGGTDVGHKREVGVLLLFALAQFAPMLLLETIYDRYLLVMFPAIIILLMYFVEEKKFLLCLILSLLLFGTVVESLRVYLDRNNLRWQLASSLVAHGLRPGRIDAGFEWDGVHLYRAALLNPSRWKWAPWESLKSPICTITDREPLLESRTYYSEFYLHQNHLGITCRADKKFIFGGSGQ